MRNPDHTATVFERTDAGIARYLVTVKVSMPSSTPRKTLVVAVLVAVGALSASCSADIAPTQATDRPRTPFSPSAAAVVSDVDLKATLEQEKHRIFLESERSKVVYDSLKLEWDRHLSSDFSRAGLLMCDPLQYVGQAQIVGPDGADLSVGPHKLRIPKGALKVAVVITAEMPVSTRVGVELRPHGLVFAQKATVSLSYAHCSRPTDIAKSVVYHRDTLILETTSSTDDTRAEMMRGQIGHFSGYAIAHGKP